MAVTIAQTANPAGVSASSSVATYSSVSIGTAASNRIVVVAVASELASTPINSCTIDYGSGDTSMTAGSAGNFGAVYARLFYLLVPTGTTATIKVTFGTNSPTSTQNHISVHSVLGAAYSSAGSDGSTDMDATDPLTTGSITIASGGGFIAVAGGATDTVAKTWANATAFVEADAGAFRFTTARRTSSLTATAITCTGTTNGEDGALSYIIFAENTSPTVSLSSPGDGGNTSDTTPDLTFTGTDSESNDIRYNVEVDTATFSDITLGNTTTRNSTTSPDSWAFDSGTGSNRIMIVGFSNFDTTAGDRQVSSITYGGEALTKVTGAVADNATSNGRAELWYRIAPLTGSNTLAVTYGGAPTNSDYFVAIFNNVHQSSPIDDSDFGTTTGGTSNVITLTTTVSDCMLVDVNNGDAGPMSIGTGQTSLMDLSGSTGRGSYKLVQTPGNYTMTVSTSANDNYAHGAIALKPVARLIDKVSGTDAGFSGTPDNTDPFTSGQAVTYTVQSALSAGTTYYWRVRGIDPSGSNTYGSWSSVRSFTVISATITGTITASVNEADIVVGGKTLIITLTGDTWIAAGAASFDLQRDEIIAGVDSAQSEALGWDLVPKATQSLGGVVRTSDTVVTITWDAFATYDITAQETITVTVPATAITSGVSIVASPTFTIATSGGTTTRLLTLLGAGS